MNVLSEKRMELSQTVASLSGLIGMEKGCKRCDFCQSVEDENRLFLLEEWDTEENLMAHLKSEHFDPAIFAAFKQNHQSFRDIFEAHRQA